VTDAVSEESESPDRVSGFAGLRRRPCRALKRSVQTTLRGAEHKEARKASSHAQAEHAGWRASCERGSLGTIILGAGCLIGPRLSLFREAGGSQAAAKSREPRDEPPSLTRGQANSRIP